MRFSTDLHKKRADAVLARAPGLLGLDLPLPSIPILSPILTPLLGGAQQQQQQPAPTAAPQPAPAPSPKPAPPQQPAPAPPPPPAPPSGGSGSGSSSAGGSSGSPSSGSSSSAGGSSGSPSSGSSGGASGGTSSGGSSGSAAGSTTSGSSSSGASSPAQGASAPNSPSAPSNSSPNNGNDPSIPAGTPAANSSAAGSTTAAAGVPGTANTTALNGTAVSGDGTASAVENAAPGVSQIGKGATGAAAAAATGTAAAAAAAATLGAAPGGTPGSSGSVGTGGTGTGTGTGIGTIGGSDGNGGTGADAAASGAHKKMPVGAAVGGVLGGLLLLCLLLLATRRWHTRRRGARLRAWGERAFPPMASARSSFATTIDRGAFPPSPGAAVPPLPPGAAAHVRAARVSVQSDGGGTAQYLLAPHDAAPPQLSPISVRPFSPNESWSFPKPPTHSPTSPASGARARPGEQRVDAHDTVRRPFVPTLPDEVAVRRGDAIRVSAVFDDGWARIEKADGTVGLIPIDCMREAGEDLPAFLAARRVSSYDAIGTAS